MRTQPDVSDYNFTKGLLADMDVSTYTYQVD